MTRALDDRDRRSLAEAVREGMSVRAAAKKYGVSPSTASKICRDAGVHTAGRASTEKATEASAADARDARQKFAAALLADMEWYRRLGRHLATQQVSRELEGTGRTDLTQAQKAAVMMGIAVDKYVRLTADLPNGADRQARTLLEDLAQSLRDYA